MAQHMAHKKGGALLCFLISSCQAVGLSGYCRAVELLSGLSGCRAVRLSGACMTVGQCRTECKDLTCQKVLSDCCFLSGLLSGCRHDTDCRAVGLLSYVPGSVRGSDIYTV